MDVKQEPKYKKEKYDKDEYAKKYYEKNKMKWKEVYLKKNEGYYDCDLCQCSVKYASKRKHEKSKKHNANVNKSNS